MGNLLQLLRFCNLVLNMDGFLAPYKETRYHLPEFRKRGRPRGKKEKFNYAHSSLRNVIERCFGVLKARFPILKLMPSYSFTKQMFIVVACMTCHNFIRLHAIQDDLFEEYENENMVVEEEEEPSTTAPIDVTESNLMFRKGDEIANEIYTNRR